MTRVRSSPREQRRQYDGDIRELAEATRTLVDRIRSVRRDLIADVPAHASARSANSLDTAARHLEMATWTLVAARRRLP